MNIRYINADKLYKGLDKAVINNSTRISSKGDVTYIEFTPFDEFDWVKLHFQPDSAESVKEYIPA